MIGVIATPGPTRKPVTNYNPSSPTTRYPTYKPTYAPTNAFRNIKVSYNMSRLKDENYNINFMGTVFEDDMEKDIKSGITEIIKPTPTPTAWYIPEVEKIYFSQPAKTLDLYVDIEVYWKATDEVKQVQESLSFEDNMEQRMRIYFNNTALDFSVDRSSIRVYSNAYSLSSLITLLISAFILFVFF